MAQLSQDVVEELLRDGIGLCDVGNLGERAGFDPGEMDHRLQPVLALVRQHGSSSTGAGSESAWEAPAFLQQKLSFAPRVQPASATRARVTSDLSPDLRQ